MQKNQHQIQSWHGADLLLGITSSRAPDYAHINGMNQIDAFYICLNHEQNIQLYT